jgi:hypothetical protein
MISEVPCPSQTCAICGKAMDPNQRGQFHIIRRATGQEKHAHPECVMQHPSQAKGRGDHARVLMSKVLPILVGRAASPCLLELTTTILGRGWRRVGSILSGSRLALPEGQCGLRRHP